MLIAALELIWRIIIWWLLIIIAIIIIGVIVWRGLLLGIGIRVIILCWIIEVGRRWIERLLISIVFGLILILLWFVVAHIIHVMNIYTQSSFSSLGFLGYS
jgi:hypothetical protein